VRIFLAVIFLTITTAGYCRTKSDVEEHKNFIEKIAETMYQQPSKDADKTITLKEIKSKSDAPVFKKVIKINTFTSEKFDFSNSTPYGNFKVIIITTSENSFTVSFEADYPIQQYQLRDTATKNITTKGELNDLNNYTFTVNRKFEPKYLLILSLYKDNIITQNIIPLYKKANIKYTN